jgi:hypothetical protein
MTSGILGRSNMKKILLLVAFVLLFGCADKQSSTIPVQVGKLDSEKVEYDKSLPWIIDKRTERIQVTNITRAIYHPQEKVIQVEHKGPEDKVTQISIYPIKDYSLETDKGPCTFKSDVFLCP